MSLGGGKTNRMMLEEQKAARQERQQIFNQMQEKTPGQIRFETGASNFSKWLDGKDYSTAPTETTLNFDLLNPARVNEQRQRLADLDGVGAANMGGGGDGGGDSVALQMVRERNANAAAEDAGAAYESAVKQTDAYYKGNDLSYAQFEISKLNSLLGNSSNREQHYNNAFIQTRPQSIVPMLLGGALSAGMNMLLPGSGALMGGLGAAGRGPMLAPARGQHSN